MRAYLVSSITVTCAAALALPLSLATPAASLQPVASGAQAATGAPSTTAASSATGTPSASGVPSAPGVPDAAPGAVVPDAVVPDAARAADASARPDADVAGSTQSLPLAPLGDDRRALRAPGATGTAQGLTRRNVRPFSLVGVVWDDARAHLHGTVQVRTRATGSGAWSPWQDVEVHNDEHGADPDTPEAASGAVRGATAPLWVGDSDGVEIRVQPERGAADSDDLSSADAEGLPTGLRLELVDPGEEPAAEPDRAEEPGQGQEPGRAAELGQGQEPGQVPEPDQAAGRAAHAEDGKGRPASTRVARRGPTVEEAAAFSVNAQLAPVGAAAIPAAAAAKPYIGPRPKIITRKGWGANEKLREKGFVYTKSIKAAFVHHSATGNNYTCKQAPSVLRSIYRYHTQSSGWRDFGYNFAVDKCGNIYEGRAGGVAKPVLGAHTLGFNTNSMGIAVLGTYSSSNPPAAVTTAIARLTAWKLGLHGGNPKGKATLVSGGGNRYKKGTKVKFNAIAGHRDGYATACPGARLYGKLGTARAASAKYQGRR
ncbi:N-acetylmuramoyl-L-alanine amidase [Streptomyces sp. NPDC090127]|uniref:N-acetylmuramoyl-L-alanine amidase n=1 Tax=Streptomyces sp. NPDC090127 TaxID=3365953 RepID=UPI0037F9F79F